MGKFSLSHVILYSSYLIVIDYIYTVRFLKFDALIYSFHLEKKKNLSFQILLTVGLQNSIIIRTQQILTYITQITK